MDELTAVNYMLDTIGESPVNTLDSGHPDVDSALARLRAAARRVQSKGLWFNKDYDVTFTPEEVTKRIHLRDIRSVETFNRDIMQRGDLLYNRAKQTYQFDAEVVIPIVIRYLPFDMLPEIAQEAAQYRAASEFIRNEIGDVQKANTQEEQEAFAKIELNSEHLRNEKFNMFNNTRIGRARLGTRPYGRTSPGRFFGTPDR